MVGRDQSQIEHLQNGVQMLLRDRVGDCPTWQRTFRSTARAVMVDKESLTGIEQEVQITERIRHAMESYFIWLQNAMSASPWSNVDFNKKLISNATDNVTAAVGLVQRLSQAKTLEEAVKIQTEFMSKQLDSFNEQTKTMIETCTKAAQNAAQRSS
jgi:hypothetical protein